jgi:predicted nucleic acid-binding protein
VAAIAELEVGCHGGTADYEKARREITQLVADNGFKVRDITKHTVKVYGDLKWRLMVRFNRQGKAKRPETWPLPDTAGTLGIDEFDLLAAAHAMEFGLVLVTSDAMPRRIREVLDEMTPKLSIENWIKMPGQP